MAGNLSKYTEKSEIQSIVEELNLPKFLAGQAGNALSRLIAGVIDIPTAKLNQITQGIKDITNARSTVMQVIAEKTAELVVSDPEILERAKIC